jgi:hypothetical protein
LHIVRCDGVVSSLDFGCLRSRNLLAIGLRCNKVRVAVFDSTSL